MNFPTYLHNGRNTVWRRGTACLPTLHTTRINFLHIILRFPFLPSLPFPWRPFCVRPAIATSPFLREVVHQTPTFESPLGTKNRNVQWHLLMSITYAKILNSVDFWAGKSENPMRKVVYHRAFSPPPSAQHNKSGALFMHFLTQISTILSTVVGG